MTDANFETLARRFHDRGGPGRVFAHMMRNADLLSEHMARIANTYYRPFLALYANCVDADDATTWSWLQTTSDDLFVEFATERFPWAEHAVAYTHQCWPTVFYAYDMGAGPGVVLSDDVEIDIAAESTARTLRRLTQFDPLTGQPRSPKGGAFFLYLLGAGFKARENPVVLRLLVVVFSEALFDLLDVHLEADADAAGDDERAFEFPSPDWQRNMFGPYNPGCTCPRCMVKRIDTAGELSAVLDGVEPAGRTRFFEQQGQGAVAAYLSTLGIARAIAVEGVKFEHRLLGQRFINMVQGAPQMLSRDDLRRVVEEDSLWDQFSTPFVLHEFEPLMKVARTFANVEPEALASDAKRINVGFELGTMMTEIRTDKSPTESLDAFTQRMAEKLQGLKEP